MLGSMSNVLSCDNGTLSAAFGAACSNAFKNALTNCSELLTTSLLPPVSNDNVDNKILSALSDRPMVWIFTPKSLY